MFIDHRDSETAAAEERVARLCGLLNSTTAALVDQIAEVVDRRLWEWPGIRSVEHWVILHCGVSPARARWLVGMAGRLRELPVTKESFRSGELTEDQVKLVVRHAPVCNDREVAELARQMTVPQLQRTLSSYSFVEPAAADAPAAGDPPPEEPRSVSFGFGEDGTWRLAAHLPGDEGALCEKALAVLRDELFHSQDPDAKGEISWADAFVATADAALVAKGAGRPRPDRYLTLLHVETDPAGSPHGRVHLGPPLPQSLRRLLTCDGHIKPISQVGGVAVNVGRTQRIVPTRTRIVVEDRDRGCRVPGCANRRWTEVHHIVHWENGGPTDTTNLVSLCGPHHRMHHQGHLGITGDPDKADGLEFTNGQGRRLRAGPTPVPPGDPPAHAAHKLALPHPRWQHPSGEQADPKCIWFGEPPAA